MRLTYVWSGPAQHKGSRWKRWSAVCAVVLAMAATLFSQTLNSQKIQRPNRITQEVSSGAVVPVPGTVHPLTRRATDLGQVSSAMEMGSLTLNIALSAAQQAELDALLAAQQDPKSPQYHQWLTQEEYGARFGLTDADLNAVTQWLTLQGFTVKGVAQSRNAIYFGGKAWQVESAFHTQLHQYKLNDEMHFANATEIRVPAALGSVLLNVRGLNNFRLKPQVQKRPVPRYTIDTGNGLENFLTPADWATTYDVKAIYDAGYTGAGTYVGVVGQTYAPPSDITNFRSASGLSAASLPGLNSCPASNSASLCYVCIDSTVANCTGASAISTAGDLGEADLDIEWAGGIAKNATVVYVYAPYSDVYKVVDPVTNQYCTQTSNPPACEANSRYNVFDALQRAVQDYTVPATGKVLPVISMSYTDCEYYFSGNTSYQNWVTQIGQQANLQGQTIVVASGDAGAAGCDGQAQASASGGLYAPVPADSPYYTGVGGTTLSGDESNASLYWNGMLNPDSALQYIPETVWNDTAAVGALAASGSGVSRYYGQPAWQPKPTNYTGAPGRFVPDVSFAASAYHDGYLACSSEDNSQADGTMCANNTFFSSLDQAFYSYGGTSAAAPSFAGMLTLLAQAQGKGLGNINGNMDGSNNPLTLYSLATNPTTYARIFHDIGTSGGNNIVPCSWLGNVSTEGDCLYQAIAPLPFTVAGDYAGYSATTGYDLATGLGSIDGYQLYLALGGTALSPSTTAITVSPTTVMQGATVTISSTVSGSGATPTGNVTFSVGSNTLGTVPLTNGTASLTAAASTAGGFSTGLDTIKASYGGSTTYSASSGTASLTVTAVSYTISPSPSAVSMADGSSSVVTLAITPTNYTGAVTLTASSSSANISAILSSSSVSLAPGAQSPTLTISASSSAANHSPVLPWRSGGAVVFAVLLGAPFTLRRRRALMILLTALTISAAGVMMSCGGSSSSSVQKLARTYTVTVTAKGSGTVTDPQPVQIVVTVP